MSKRPKPPTAAELRRRASIRSAHNPKIAFAGAEPNPGKPIPTIEKLDDLLQTLPQVRQEILMQMLQSRVYERRCALDVKHANRI